MSYSNQFYSDYLEETRNTFDNLPEFPDFLAIIAGKGYPDTRIEEGRELHTVFGTCIHKYLDRRQTKKAKGKEMNEKFFEVSRTFLSHVRRLRKEYAFDNEVLIELGLTLSMDQKRAGFIVQATSFYNKALNTPSVFAKLQSLGYTQVDLEAGRDSIRDYQVLRSQYDMLSGECQELVVERNRAFKKLKIWMDAFIATCKFLFADNLQTLEKVGIFIRNQPIRKKQEEPAETDGSTTDGGTTDGGTADSGTTDGGTTG